MWHRQSLRTNRVPLQALDIHDSGKNGLQALARMVLFRDLQKDLAVRCGDWTAAVLSDRQIEYAALDAVAGRAVLLQLAKQNQESGEQFARPFIDVPFSSKPARWRRQLASELAAIR